MKISGPGQIVMGFGVIAGNTVQGVTIRRSNRIVEDHSAYAKNQVTFLKYYLCSEKYQLTIISK